MLLLIEHRAAVCSLVSAATWPGDDDPETLLIASNAAVAAYRRPPVPAAAAAAACGLGDGEAEPAAPQRLWRQPISGGRVELAAPLCPDSYLLVTSHGPAARAQASVVQVLGSAASPQRQRGQQQQQLWQQGGGAAAAPPRHHKCASVPLDCGEQQHEPPARPAFSSVVAHGGSRGAPACWLLLASLHQGTVHVLKAEQRLGGHWHLSATPHPLSELLSAEQGAAIVVESLALAPPGLGGSEPQAVVLYSLLGLGGGARTKHTACLELQPHEGRLHRCCWFLRNVHPSTSLVAALPRTPSGPCTLVAAPRSLTIVPAAAPQDKRQVAVQLAGRPTCAVQLSSGAAVVGDSSGHLTLLDLQQPAAAPVPLASLLPGAPRCLALLPTTPAAPGAAAAGEPAPGLLFAGCTSGAAFLQVPPGAVQQDGTPTPRWEAVGGGDAALLEGSLAPVVGCCAAPDPSGCGDACLLLCCGAAPFSRLAVGWLAAGLLPLAVGGDDLPGQARLLGLRASPTAARHRYLLLSSDSGGGWTAALEVGGEGLGAAALLPGLQLDAETLLAGPLQGGCMVQATAAVVRVFRPSTGADVAAWRPPAGAAITLAAQHGQYLAAACGAEVQVLHCSATGRLQPERELSLPQQASALLLFDLGGEVWLAAGLWHSNQVVLLPLSAEQPACCLDLGARQPRSLLAWWPPGADGGDDSAADPGSPVDGGSDDGYACSTPGGSSMCGSPTWGRPVERGAAPPEAPRGPHLVVGTASGEVLWWRLRARRDAFGASSALALEPCGWVRAGVAPVSLHLLPPDPAAAAAAAFGDGGGSGQGRDALPCALALSDQALLLHPQRGRLVASRLHGGRGVTAACPLLVPELPGSRLAYIGPAGQLCIGALDSELRLRADQLQMRGGGEATAVAYHAPSGCAVLACAEPGGGSCLRLVDAAAMRQLARLPMGPGQSITAVAVLSLPCSSLAEQRGDAQPPQQQAAGCKEFVVVAVSDEGTSGSGDGGSTASLLEPERLPAPPEDDKQPWWRQQQQQQQQQGSAQHQDADSEGSSSDCLPQRGQLLVFEVQRGPAQLPGASTSVRGSGSGSPGSDQLILHGTCPLPAAAFSLATVQPDPQPFEAGSSAAAAATSPRSRGAQQTAPSAQQPLLAAGCDDGMVRLFRVYVDDAGVEGRLAVERGLAAIAAAVQPLRLAQEGAAAEGAAAGGAAAEGASAGGAAAEGAENSGPAAAAPAAGGAAGPGGRRLWHQHVALQLVAKAPTCFEGVPASLEARGPTLFARDLLSSLTVFRAQPAAAGEAPRLLPLAADASGRCLDAALALSDTQVLAGEAGGSLLLLRRDVAAERDRLTAARRRWELARELGGGGGEAQQYLPSLRDAAPLDAVASHEVAGSVAAVVPCLLGVPLHQAEELLGGGGSGGGSSSSSETGPITTVIVVSTSGAIATAHCLAPEAHRVLRQLAAAAEATCYCDAGDGSGQAHKLAVAADGGAEAGPGGCVDGGALAAAFQQPAWHARLAKAAPSTALQRGQALLESYGLL